MKQEIPEFIMERIFEMVEVNGEITTIKLHMGKPYIISETSSSLKWRCPFQITGIGSEKIKEAPGIDSIDSMLIGLKLAEIFLKSYGRIGEKNLTWLNEDNLGLSTMTYSEIDEDDNHTPTGEDNLFSKIFDEFFRNIDGGNTSL